MSDVALPQRPLRELALFAGAGGGILGGLLLGWRCVCAVEIDPYCQRVLLARQRDGILQPFPIWDDVRTFDGRPWRGHVDVISGGFPCQDISSAGKRAGLDGERSGLWSEFARNISEVRPLHVFVENSPMLTGRGLGRVLGDLASLGFDAKWGVLGAADAGAPHQRDRIWVMANSQGMFRDGRADHAGGSSEGTKTSRSLPKPGNAGRDSGSERDWWSAEPSMGRVAHGLASPVDRLHAIGNGQVPAVVRLAWETLK